jgi:hypothetical protein
LNKNRRLIALSFIFRHLLLVTAAFNDKAKPYQLDAAPEEARR